MSRMSGKPYMTSTKRIRRLSTFPPMEPANAPTGSPIASTMNCVNMPYRQRGPGAVNQTGENIPPQFVGAQKVGIAGALEWRSGFVGKFILAEKGTIIAASAINKNDNGARHCQLVPPQPIKASPHRVWCGRADSAGYMPISNP